MKHKHILLLALFSTFQLLQLKLCGQSPGFFSKYWSGQATDASLTSSTGCAKDASGNSFLVSEANATNCKDILITKFDAFGTQDWQVSYDGSENLCDKPHSILVDGENEIIVLGTQEVATDEDNIVVLKYSTDGTLQWSYSFTGNGSGSDIPVKILADGENNIYAVANVSGENEDKSIMIIKLTNGGSLDWSTNFDFSDASLDEAADAAFGETEDENSILITGTTQNSAPRMILFSCFTDDGGIAWSEDYTNSSNENSWGRRILITASGDIFAGGRVGSGASDYDFFLLLASPDNGSVEESAVRDFFTGQDELHSIAITSTGIFVAAGFSEDPDSEEAILSVEGTVNWQSFQWGGSTPVNSLFENLNDEIRVELQAGTSGSVWMLGSIQNEVNWDHLLIKLDDDGNTVRQEQFNSSGNVEDFPGSLLVDATEGLIFVTGLSENSTDYNADLIVFKEIVPTESGESGTPISGFTYFENKGQVRDEEGDPVSSVRYAMTNQFETDIYVSDDAVDLVWAKSSGDTSIPDTSFRVHMNFPGSSENARCYAGKSTDEKVNYYKEWAPEGLIGFNGYEEVVIADLYEGIDLHLTSQVGDGFKFFFTFDASADPEEIRMNFDGATDVSINSSGNEITVSSGLGSVEFEIATVYELDGNGNPDELACVFYEANDDIAFDITGWTGTAIGSAVVIGPPPAYTSGTSNHWTTYLGHSSSESAGDVYLHSSNQIYVTGITGSPLFPVYAGTYTSYLGYQDAFLGRFNSGRRRVWMTFYGGVFYDSGEEVTFTNNAIYMSGHTSSGVSFPGCAVCPGFYQAGSGGGGGLDIFLVRLTPSGTLNWSTGMSTTYGVNGYQKEIHGITSDALGNVYLGGVSFHEDAFNLVNLSGAYNQAYGGGDNDSWIAKFDSGNDNPWMTYFGGANSAMSGDISEEVTGMATDGDGNLYLTGTTGSYGNIESSPCTGPTTPGLFPLTDPGGDAYIADNEGDADAYIAKFDADGRLIWSTMYGGNNRENWHSADHNNDGIAIMSNGDIVVVGTSASNDLFTVNPTGTSDYFDGSANGGKDAFILKFDGSDYELEYATYFGGAGNDGGIGVKVNGNDNIFVTGYAQSGSSTSFPIQSHTAHWQQSGFGGGTMDAYILKMGSNLSQIWTTFLGGNGTDYATALAVDNGYAQLVIVGETRSDNFPVSDITGLYDYFDGTANGSGDAFISNLVHNCTGCAKMDEPEFEAITNEAGTMTAYPNPSNGIFTIRTQDSEEIILSYEIMDAQGKWVSSGSGGSSEVTINLQDANAGIYLIKVLSKTAVSTIKIIKQ